MSTKMKKIILVIVSVLMLAVLLSVNAFAARDAVGDLNRDGVKDEKDAIYLLNHYIFGDMIDGNYDIDQPSDYNGDGKVDEEDAIYLLNNILFSGVLDTYHICDHPESWEVVEEVPANCKEGGYTLVRCKCGKEANILPTEKTDSHSFDWENPDLTHQATCLENGYITATCTVCGETETQQQQATGKHNWQGGSCETGAVCGSCGTELPASGHDYPDTPTYTKPATCEGGYNEYACRNENCKSTYRVDLAPTDHRFADNAWKTVGEKATDKDCIYVYIEAATCEDCGKTIEKTTGEVEKHTEVTTVTPATCVKDGQKVISCSVCKKELMTTVMPVPELESAKAHQFDDGVTEGSVTTFTCLVDGCGATKTTVKATEDGKVDIGAAEEVELDNGAAIIPDENIKNELGGKDVSVSIGEVKADDLDKLADEDKALLKELGDAPIFDLNLMADGEKVTDFGEDNKMTVRLPYTLAEGDDPDCIIIWYIGDDGHIDHFEAKYVDGYAVFETNHFSYYTVTRMTPAQRCAYYGTHNNQTTTVPATCVTGGYTVSICTRCGHKEITDEVPAIGHKWNSTTKAATCTENGETVYSCKACEISYTETIKAIGHKIAEVADKYKAPTCTAKGEKLYACGNEGCSFSYTEEIAQIDHDYNVSVILPDCENGGYTENVCKNCDSSFISEPVKATGHSFVEGICENCKHECEHQYEYGVCVICDLEKPAPEPEPDPDPDPDPDCKHDIVLSYEFLDENIKICELGVTITETCTKCDYVHKYTTYECVAYLHEVDLSAYDSCGKHDFSYFSCPCGSNIEWAGDVNLNEVIGQGEGVGCPDCAMKAMISTSYVEDGCIEIESQTVDFYFGDELIHTITAYGYEMNHDLSDAEYIFLDGKNCDNGFILKAHCPKCDEDVEYTLYGHQIVINETIDFTEYGLCGEHQVRRIACPCGKEDRVNLYGFSWIPSIDPNVMLLNCNKCKAQASVTTIDGEKNDKCEYNSHTKYEICLGEELIYSVETDKIIVSHNYIGEYKKLGETCDDGIEAIFVCQECGYSYTDRLFGHIYEEKKLDLSEYGICDHHGITVSACVICDKVESLWYEDMMGQKTEEGWLMFCDKCPVKIIEVEEYGAIDENCWVNLTYHNTFMCGDEVLYEYENFGRRTMHDDEERYELLGETCDDGILVVRTCKNCGREESYETQGHNLEKISIDLAEYGACSRHRVNGTVCTVCGMISRINFSGFSVESLENGTRWFCNECKINATMTENIVGSGENCLVEAEVTYLIEYAGEIIYTKTGKVSRYDHDFELSYEFKEGSTSCKDGVIVNQTCKNCGATDSYTTYGHNFESIDIDLSEYGACAEHYLSGSVCKLCGYSGGFKMGGGKMYSQSIDNGWRYFCKNCDIERISIEITGEKDENCFVPITWIETVYAGGKEIISGTSTGARIEHEYEYSFKFNDEKLGCEGGVYVTEYCSNCGESVELEEIFAHEIIVRDVYRLADHGHKCGTGEITLRSCPCGKMKEFSLDIPGFMGNGYGEVIDGVNYDYTNWECEKCGYKFAETAYTTRDEFCNAIRHVEFSFGDITISCEENVGKEHVTTEKVLEDESCVIENADGTVLNVTAFENYCENCKASISKRICKETKDANGFVINCIDEYYRYEMAADGSTTAILESKNEVAYLVVDSVNDKIRVNLYEYRTNYDYEGNESYWEKREYSYKDNNYCAYTLSFSNLYGDNWTEENNEHYGRSSKYVLSEGSSSCLESLDRVWFCTLCGTELDRSYYGPSKSHRINWNNAPTATIDFGEYGAVCGGKLEIFECACGINYQTRIDSKCDFGFEGTKGIIDENGVEHQYEIYTCAVSNCGFKYVLDITYEVNDTCDEVRTYTYYLGVDETNENYNGTYSFSYSTGNKRHAQTKTDVTVTDTRYYSSTFCPKCGKTERTIAIENGIRTETNYEYRTDGTLSKKFIYKYFATENRRYRYEILSRNESYDADGTCTWWYQMETTFPNAANGDYCTVIRTESNIDGMYVSNSSSNHSWTHNEYPCTPEFIEMHCMYCGSTQMSRVFSDGHVFSYNDATGMFECDFCGLESYTDGNGQVIFQDRTAELGDGSKYHIGVKNNYVGEYVWNVSLVNVSTGELVFLDDIAPEIVDEYNVTLDTSAIFAAAKDLGFTDCGFMVRLAFVPVDGKGELDYAITLDPHVYELTGRSEPKEGCESGYAYSWTYTCIFCDSSYTEEKYGHAYSDTSRETLHVDENGVITSTRVTVRTCSLCGDSETVTYTEVFGPNGQCIKASSESSTNDKSNYETIYEYDYANNLRTEKHIRETYTDVDTYDMATGEQVAHRQENNDGSVYEYTYIYIDGRRYTATSKYVNKDGSWRETVNTYDFENDLRTAVITHSNGQRTESHYRISDGVCVYSRNESEDGFWSESNLVYNEQDGTYTETVKNSNGYESVTVKIISQKREEVIREKIRYEDGRTRETLYEYIGDRYQPVKYREEYPSDNSWTEVIYTYDLENGMRTLTTTNSDGYRRVEMINQYDNYTVYRYDEYADGSWNKYEYDFDYENDVRTQTQTNSDGSVSINKYSISEYRLLYSKDVNSDGSFSERQYIHDDANDRLTEIFTNKDGDVTTWVNRKSDGRQIYTETVSADKTYFSKSEFSYDEVNGIRTIVTTNSQGTCTTKLQTWPDCKLISSETTYADGSWSKTVVELDKDSGMTIQTTTTSQGDKRVERFEIKTGRLLYSEHWSVNGDHIITRYSPTGEGGSYLSYEEVHSVDGVVRIRSYMYRNYNVYLTRVVAQFTDGTERVQDYSYDFDNDICTMTTTYNGETTVTKTYISTGDIVA